MLTQSHKNSSPCFCLVCPFPESLNSVEFQRLVLAMLLKKYEIVNSAKTGCIAKKGVVYKLQAGWFINRPGEFINWGLFIKFKGLLCGNPTERAESLILNFWPPGSL